MIHLMNMGDAPHNKLEYDQITDQIYVGTNFCCQVHFDKELLDLGIYADISLEGERVDAPFGVDYYLWLPVPDTQAPKQDQLMQGANAIKSLIDAGKKIYIHCMNGHGRGPTLAAGYLISTGMSTEEAVDLLHKKRRGSHILSIQQKALKQFQQTIKKQD